MVRRRQSPTVHPLPESHAFNASPPVTYSGMNVPQDDNGHAELTSVWKDEEQLGRSNNPSRGVPLAADPEQPYTQSSSSVWSQDEAIQAGQSLPSPAQDLGESGMASLAITGSPKPHKSTAKRSNNPFLQHVVEEKIAVDMESSANVWDTAVDPPLKQASYYHDSQTLPSEFTAASAQGQMAEWASSQGPTFPSLPVIPTDDPWKDIDFLDNKTSSGNKPLPRPRLEMPPPNRQTGPASPRRSSIGKQTLPKSPVSKSPPTVQFSKSGHQTRAAPASPVTSAKKERNEFYQIKHIRWRDSKVPDGQLRTSPILIQNANGPCPLLALVNALVLSTPPSLQTALVETLQTREQVSLGLLLDAVFDELMSGRRGETAQELPDVGELYSFLVTLHTGMNVNPRFVTPGETPSLIDADDTTLRAVGGFEDTQEMRMYSTFSIPLIHGWLPRPEESASAAFSRAAQTYEDAQNILFREEELEGKLQSGELSSAEQELYMDLSWIKNFFAYWPTQLTTFGLQRIQNHLEAGQMSILFRNDHFSLLYKEPRTNKLMTLVTDAGYATHDEIVWESLEDISGTQSELFAGDFKSVSHHKGQTEQSDQVSSASTIKKEHPPQGEPATLALANKDVTQGSSRLTSTEQEDHDLALALQLQEEEEERERNEQAARRRREEELSAQFLAQEGHPVVPPRRSRGSTQPQRASTTAQAPVAGQNQIDDSHEEAAPPSYEQAASSPPYHPSGSVLTSTLSNSQVPSGNQQRPRRRATARQSLVDQIPPPPLQTARTSDSTASSSGNEKCIVM